MLGLFVTLLIVLVIFAIFWWILQQIPIPPQFKWIVNVVIGIIFLICVISLLTGNFPVFGSRYPLH